MIAPIRPHSPTDPHLAGARRAVRELFLQPGSSAVRRKPELSRRAAWLLLGWTAIVAVLYLIRGRN